MPPPIDFSAAPSALGYLYQVRYSLALLLQSTEANCLLSLEKLDDVAFEVEGEAVELLQFKHHVSHRASLTDSSPDLWKTLRVWMSKLRDGSLDLTSTLLTLVTTSTAPEDSAAYLLREGSGRNEVEALQKLRAAGAASTSDVIKTAWQQFETGGEAAQEAMLARIRVVDVAPDIQRGRDRLEEILRFCTRPNFVSQLCDRLEGWWFRKAISHLRNPAQIPGISLGEAWAEINDLAEQFRKDNLPMDFPVELDLEETDISPDERLFVEQLRVVMVSHERIKMAISDYWRAFQQRSRWVRDDLILDEDLYQYEDRLTREWQEQFIIMKENLREDADHAFQGRTLYNRVVIEGDHIPIRPAFPNPYVMRGSFHMLANALKVGWHPQFRERFTRALDRAAEAAS